VSTEEEIALSSRKSQHERRALTRPCVVDGTMKHPLVAVVLHFLAGSLHSKVMLTAASNNDSIRHK
jgi:hypothetical protein